MLGSNFVFERTDMVKKDKVGSALMKYNKAILNNPHDYRAYNNRGNLYLQMGNYKRAISDYNKAIEENPEFALVYINRGYAYQEMGFYELSIADYSKAIELNPLNSMAFNNRGFTFLLMGKYEEAEIDIKKALEISPDNIYALNSMAEFHAIQDNKDEACRWLRIAIDKGFNNWNYIKTSKTYDNIRNHPCFKEIVSKR